VMIDLKKKKKMNLSGLENKVFVGIF